MVLYGNDTVPLRKDEEEKAWYVERQLMVPPAHQCTET